MVSEVNLRLVQFVRDVADSDVLRRKEGMFVLHGFKPLEKLIAAGQKDLIEVVFLTPQMQEDYATRAILTSMGDVTIEEVESDVQGSLCCNKEISPVALVRALPSVKFADEKFLVLLESITSQEVLGSILRTAHIMGVEFVVLSPGCADPWSPTAIHHARGAQFSLKIAHDVELERIAAVFKGEIAHEFLDKDSRSLYDTDLSTPIALCFSERDSITGYDMNEIATKKFFIPRACEREYLAPGVSASITMAEKFRQDHLINLPTKKLNR